MSSLHVPLLSHLPPLLGLAWLPFPLLPSPLSSSLLRSEAVQHSNRYYVRAHLHVALQQSDVSNCGARHTRVLSSQAGTGV